MGIDGLPCLGSTVNFAIYTTGVKAKERVVLPGAFFSVCRVDFV